MMVPNWRLRRVSTLDKVGFFGTSASLELSRAVSIEFNLAFFTLLMFVFKENESTKMKGIIISAIKKLLFFLIYKKIDSTKWEKIYRKNPLLCKNSINLKWVITVNFMTTSWVYFQWIIYFVQRTKQNHFCFAIDNCKINK